MNKTVTLQTIDGHAYATSVQIAKHFHKDHDKICRDIRNAINQVSLSKIGGSNPFLFVDFRESNYVSRGHTYPQFLLSRDAFTLLVFGFTGQEATDWKLMYIAAFNEMEARLRRQIEDAHRLARAEQSLLKEGEIELVRRSRLISRCVEDLHALGLLPELNTDRLHRLVAKGVIAGKIIPRQSIVYIDAMRDYLKSLGIIPIGLFAEQGGN